MIKQSENGDHFYGVNKGSYQAAFYPRRATSRLRRTGRGNFVTALHCTAPRAATVIYKGRIRMGDRA